MAFGFRRLPGTSRRFEAIDAPGYEPGTVISYRQYDKYLTRLGRKQPLPGFSAILEAQRLLDSLEADLARRERAQVSEFEREAIAQSRASAAAQRKQLASARKRRERQAAGQRRYNTLIRLFREETGQTRAEVIADPEFIEMRQALRKREPGKMKEMFQRYGEKFRELYEDLYGRIVGTVTRNNRIYTRVVLPSGRMIHHRRV